MWTAVSAPATSSKSEERSSSSASIHRAIPCATFACCRIPTGPALFSGDTLFNAGAGNCHNGGHPDELFETFETQLKSLPDDTAIYPGHDYLLNNLGFTLDREPDNEVARRMIRDYENQDPANALVTSMADEREINTFFRLQSPTVVAKLAEEFPELGDNPDARTVFLKLRELRNSW